MAFDFIADAIEKRTQQNLLRERYCVVSNRDNVIEINQNHYINFASNDYLGLSQHPQVAQAYVEGLAVYGCGSGASSVITGYSAEHKALEDEICEILNKPSAMLFSSGFAANQAICHALFHTNSPLATQKHANGSILCDKLMHASFIEGALTSGANLHRFRHNDFDHARTLLDKSALAQTNILLATEGIFSMDGDSGQVSNLIATVQAHVDNSSVKPWIMIDDAHAIGVVGQSGFGSLDTPEVNSHLVDVVMGTFGKALGTSGAFVAGSYEFIQYMINMSKHYVYSTALSGAQMRATRVSLALVAQGQEREKLHKNIDYFLQKAKIYSLPLLPSSSPIQPLIIGEPKLAITCSKQLADLGLWIPAIRTPTVPPNTDRLRIIINALHTEKDIDALVDSLVLVLSKNGILE